MCGPEVSGEEAVEVTEAEEAATSGGAKAAAVAPVAPVAAVAASGRVVATPFDLPLPKHPFLPKFAGRSMLQLGDHIMLVADGRGRCDYPRWEGGGDDQL